MVNKNLQVQDEGMWSNGVFDENLEDLMSTLILDRLEASFDSGDDELPQITHNMINGCDGCPQQTTCTGGESSKTEYFDSVWNHEDNTGHLQYCTTTDNDSIACTSLLYDGSIDGFPNENNNSCRCSNKLQCSLTDYQSTESSIESITEKIKKNEAENIKQQVDIYRKRLECMLKMNYQLQSELKKSIQTNLLMAQSIAWPFSVKGGKIEFPGKNDLDQRFDCMSKELEKIRNDLKPIKNDHLIASKLDKIFKIPLPSCFNTCIKNMNKK